MAPNRITKRELDEMLSVEFDYEARVAFLKMTREEQLMAVLTAQAYLRGKIANLEKWQIDYEKDSIQYRHARERKENGHSGHDVKNTTQKIIAEVRAQMEARYFDWGVWLRDKVLPQFVSVFITIIIILMGLFLSGNFPW